MPDQLHKARDRDQSLDRSPVLKLLIPEPETCHVTQALSSFSLRLTHYWQPTSLGPISDLFPEYDQWSKLELNTWRQKMLEGFGISVGATMLAFALV